MSCKSKKIILNHTCYEHITTAAEECIIRPLFRSASTYVQYIHGHLYNAFCRLIVLLISSANRYSAKQQTNKWISRPTQLADQHKRPFKADVHDPTSSNPVNKWTNKTYPKKPPRKEDSVQVFFITSINIARRFKIYQYVQESRDSYVFQGYIMISVI